MRDGIYQVLFTSNSGDEGQGLAVFKGSSVNGGDYGYTYTGEMQASGESFTVKLTVKRWNKQAKSIFGALDEFVLNLKGQEKGDGFSASGEVQGQSGQIQIQGTFITPAA